VCPATFHAWTVAIVAERECGSFLTNLIDFGVKRIYRVAIELLGGVSAMSAMLAIACAPAYAAFPGTFAPANPYTAAHGAATMHADSESSDASPYPGPGIGAQRVQVNELGAACPTILQGSDGMPVALCTAILGQAPTVYLLDPGSGSPLASLTLPTGNLFGGVYAYLDPQNRLVVFDADGNLDRVAHSYSGGHWTLAITSATSIAAALTPRCPSLCGGVVGLAPDWRGRVWFATARGIGGFVDPATGAVKTIALGSGEQVANSISTAPQGTAIATDHALYLLDASASGAPKIVWRYGYDRGTARKPGQLSQGTGSTPTFFGPQDGTRYLAITDNASPAEHLIVIDTKATPAAHPVKRKHKHKKPKKKKAREKKKARATAGATTPNVVCTIPVLTPGPSGTENNPVGFGRSVFVANTYGYPYPTAPAGAAPTQPASAPFTGGVARVDLNPSGRGCRVVWQDSVRSAAVPRLDVPDSVLYTIQRTDSLQPDETSDADVYSSVAINAATGAVLGTTPIGAGYLSDTLQLSPTIVPGRVLYQGTISGVDRVSPSTSPLGLARPR
jgi:hypothetical protein